MEDQPHELITYNKKFKPGTAGVKVNFAPDEMAFSREDMPLRAAIARREVLLTLQPSIDGVAKKKWDNQVLVINKREPYNPQQIYVSTRNEHYPTFRPDFYDTNIPIWDNMATCDQKLENRQFRQFTEKARENTINTCKKPEIAQKPALVKRQIQYANIIKERGIPAAQPPPPFIIKRPKMSKKSKYLIHKKDTIKSYHDGVFAYNEALGGEAWSCCGNTQRDSPGCCHVRVNPVMTQYD